MVIIKDGDRTFDIIIYIEPSVGFVHFSMINIISRWRRQSLVCSQPSIKSYFSPLSMSSTAITQSKQSPLGSWMFVGDNFM